jgi:pullulanase
MIGLALLTASDKILVGVSNVYDHSESLHLKVIVDNKERRIKTIKRADTAFWKQEFRFVEGYVLWEIVFSQNNEKHYKPIHSITGHGILSSSIAVLLFWNGDFVCSKPVDRFRSVLPGNDTIEKLPAAFFPECDEVSSKFSLYAPFSAKASVLFFDRDDSMRPTWILPMKRSDRDGRETWELTVSGNLHGTVYNYLTETNGEVYEHIDPFSISLTLNSKRSVLLDRKYLAPEGWENDRRIILKRYSEAVVYESHVRDFTVDPRTNIENKGLYRSWCFEGGQTSSGVSAGLDHLKTLGITHVHLLPIQDFGSVDDTHRSDYNWGYDPVCYTVPEGSYSSQPEDPAQKVIEFKQLVQSLHRSRIGVILDVVYNHVWDAHLFALTKIFTEGLFRRNLDGTLSNGSGCGNEFDTKHPVFGEYLLQTLRYWIEEYHVDGFRFDLMGLIDRKTLEETAKRLHAAYPGLLLYGEPWVGGLSPLGEMDRSTGCFSNGTRIAVFDDCFRNAVKGYPDDSSTGFITGNFERTHTVLERVAAIDTSLGEGFANPADYIRYDACHDNLTLYDKLVKSRPDLSDLEIVSRIKCAHFLICVSLGIPFFHSGEEFARTKHGNSNSYQSGDLYNAIDWERKTLFFEAYAYLKAMIGLRKRYEVLKLCEAKEVKRSFCLIDEWKEGFAYLLKGNEKQKSVFIGIHLGDTERSISLPGGEWIIVANTLTAGEDPLGIAKGQFYFPPASWYLAEKKEKN